VLAIVIVCQCRPSCICPQKVYDVTSRETFDALPTWFNELETFTNSPDVVKIVVGNKLDKVSGGGRVCVRLFRRSRVTNFLALYRNTLASSLQRKGKRSQTVEGVCLSNAVQRKAKE
jgi:GTPase SAR1 family protein